MNRFLRQLQFFLHNQSGATVMEYALIAALLSIVILSTVKGIGTSMNSLFYTQVNDGLTK